MRIGCTAGSPVAGDGHAMLNLLPRGMSSGIIGGCSGSPSSPPSPACRPGCSASGTRSACSARPGSTPRPGYRAYSPAQLPELRRILALRDLGVPLAEIGGLLGGGEDLRAALERRRDDLERTRREAERQLQALEIRVALADDEHAPDVVVRPVAAGARRRPARWSPARTTPTPSTSWRRTSATSVGDGARRRARPSWTAAG